MVSRDPGQVRAEARMGLGRPKRWFNQVFRR
jgi:hypothetical protein